MPEAETPWNTQSLAYVEGLYEDFLVDPLSVPPDWRPYFESVTNGRTPRQFGPSFKPPGVFASANANGHAALHNDRDLLHYMAVLQHRVDTLIRNYRMRGHMNAHFDPLEMPRPYVEDLDPAAMGIDEADYDTPLAIQELLGLDNPTPRKVLARLKNTYCRSIGVQFRHISDAHMRRWLQDRMEPIENRAALTRDEQFAILTRLTDAIALEEFIQRKYVGAKSFSLEGAESMIPLLATAIERAGESGVEEVVIGMPHRGRLNVLVNIMGKSARQVFREYEDRDPEQHIGRGDVKYHLGHHSTWYTVSGKEVQLALCFNPSHLEYVNPVALGRVRAMQDRQHDTERRHRMALLLHGDAAFAGEGIVQETLNLGQLEGYRTGGTMHVIVNNQIGFTTTPEEGRSCFYATDVAKMLQSPIFHVNGEDPEAVAQCVALATDFRAQFQCDVFIDMYCYRRRGHNEADEPSFTQPLLYKAIKQRKSVHESYSEKLEQLGGITKAEAKEVFESRKEHLESELNAAKESEQEHRPPSVLRNIWYRYKGGPDRDVEEVDTGVDMQRLQRLMIRLTTVPEGFNVHPKLERWLDSRRAMSKGEEPLDWGAAEALAFASLAMDGARIRMSGQDAERGTFSHRHAVLHDQETGEKYMPLQNVGPGQARVDIINSPLSEAGVLGFEYGYSLAYPDGLTLWEAQFGDFQNAAQVIIDQFLSSAEDKWRSLTNLVMLLPHGFEGQGPEHSSARIERFFSLTAEDNMQVVIPSTPAQLFHALRRQVVRTWRKPLVVITPKSLLRHPECISTLDDCATGRFQRMLPDADGRIKGVKKILLCSGKVYYDLIAARRDRKRDDVAILRVEQVYPLQPEDMEHFLEPYADGTPLVWVQEEPENMGAWRRMRGKFGDIWFDRLPFTGVYRPASASPATGSPGSHKIEQKRLMDEAFA
jgi:2-oxoglutarate dehydrogenase E1 component